MSDALPFRPAGDYERRLLADEAKELLDNKAFIEAILRLRKRYFELLMAPNSTEEKLALIERIRALEDVPQQLQIFVNDEKMHQARKK